MSWWHSLCLSARSEEGAWGQWGRGVPKQALGMLTALSLGLSPQLVYPHH
jgi:hypothetical protein